MNYTEEDKRYGEEHQEIRCQHRLISEELSKYSWRTIREFDWMFRHKDNESTYLLEVLNKEYEEEQKYISEQLKKDSFFTMPVQYFTEHIHIKSPEDFWYKWNKFKKLKAFL